jgi:hypothetical protein
MRLEREKPARGTEVDLNPVGRSYVPRRSTADLDEMAEDPVDLRGVRDDSENPHAFSTARAHEGAAALGIYAVDFYDKPGSCGGGAAKLD